MQLLTFTLTGMDYGISLENVESIESKMNVVVVPTSPVFPCIQIWTGEHCGGQPCGCQCGRHEAGT